jgi:hypothetical protein
MMTIRSFTIWAVCACGLFLATGCSRQTAEEKGKELATSKIDLVKGVGDAIKDKGGAAAESVAQGAGVLLQGAGKGLDKALEWKITLGPGMGSSGLTITRMHQASTPADGSTKSVDAYVAAKQDAQGIMLVTAFDANQNELARVRTEIKISAQDARYETLKLDDRTDVGAIRSVTVDFTPKVAVASSKP